MMSMMTGYDIAQTQLPCVAQFMSAYHQCDPDIRVVVDELLQVYTSPESTEDERAMAAHTIIDAVYPSLAHNQRVAERERLGDAREIRDSFDREEDGFAANVQRRMEQLDMTQVQLAENIGVSQPAVSNILNRHSRPQRRTIQRFATALQCEPGELWSAWGDLADTGKDSNISELASATSALDCQLIADEVSPIASDPQA